ncbi:4-hydroxyphenylpyruvate dioxygenase [Actinoplanes sp. G11-F43]|uniref:4-hydroxyphenylpyruvate dioxygenase n=1 Tax=Actinoplanes sp. G11-F43 TaxID=3424130 RepID=UPI003D3583A8
MTSAPFGDLIVDHVRYYTDDLRAVAAWLGDGYRLPTFARSRPGDPSPALGIGREGIRLLVTSPADETGRQYLQRHGDGVADIALRVDDAEAAMEAALSRGARRIGPVRHEDGVTTATVAGFGDVVHTFVARAPGVAGQILPGLLPVTPAETPGGPRLHEIDHFAVCLPAGELDATVEFYERVLDFDMIFTEHIVVGTQAMNSKVVQSASGAVTFTLIEPDPRHDPGQINEFLARHGGAGVQHMAFATDDIVHAVSALEAGGVAFLDTPDAYFQMIERRLTLAKHSIADLNKLNVLVDEDHHGQLYQIFARSAHPRGTYFNEIIERLGARTFGSGNIKALYQAVEMQRNGLL